MGKKQNELGKSKFFANRGLNRNKSPIANIRYQVEILPKLKDILSHEPEYYDKYKFKDLGYLLLLSNKTKSVLWSAHGFITVEELKERIGLKQYSKFCQGKRDFIIQRRVNKKNTSISKA